MGKLCRVRLDITVIASNTWVEPEIINNKETGRLVATDGGTFYKISSQYDVTFKQYGEMNTFSFDSKESAQDFIKNTDSFDSDFTPTINQTIITEDIGSVINPSDY